VSEQLDVEPARFFVHRHIRPQYACRACETVAAAPIPPAVIDGGLAAVGLLAWVIVGKYLDHLPLYPQGARRIRKALKRQRLRCIDWKASRRAPASPWRAPPWPNGWAGWAWP
jgi:transposase